MASSPPVTIQSKDLGAGIDQLSSESSIQEGFSDKLDNWEPTAEGYLEKRTGFGLESGRLPLRVHSKVTDGPNTRLVFNPELDLSKQGKTPILIGGFNSDGTYSEVTISEYKLDPKVTIPQNTEEVPASLIIAATESGLTSPNVSLSFLEKKVGEDTYPQVVFTDTKKLTESNFQIEVSQGYNPAVTCFLVLKDRNIPGESITLGPYAGSGSSTIIAIPANTHALSTNSLQVEFYSLSGGVREFIEPNFLAISNGNIAAEFEENLSSVYAVVSVADGEVSIPVAPGNVTESNWFPIDTTYPIPQVWYVTASNREKAEVDTIEVNQTTQEMRIKVINSNEALSLVVTWEAGYILSNAITVLNTTLTNRIIGTVVWGLNQNLSWDSSNSENRAGWVNYIDSYRALGEGYLLAGTDRNLYKPGTSSPASAALRGRILLPANQKVSPVFQEEGSSIWSSPYIKTEGGLSGWLRASSVDWVSGTNVTFTVPLSPGYTSDGSLTGQYLTVRKASYKPYEGVWRITGSSISGNTLNITCSISSSSNGDWNGGLAQVGIFSSSFSIPATVSTPAVGDILLVGDILNDEYTVKEVTIDSVVVDGFVEQKELAGGTPFYVTSRPVQLLLPLRSTSGALSGSTVGCLTGDSVTIGANSQQYEIRDMVSIPTQTIAISSQSFLINPQDAAKLRAGQRILLNTGTYTIDSLDTDSGAVGVTEEIPDGSYVLIGNTIEVERPLDFVDASIGNILVSLKPRWFPLARQTASQLPFSTDSQFSISSMAADSMYIVTPEVTTPALKWDGTSLTRAGIPRWAPQAFTSIEYPGSITPPFRTPLGVTATDGVKGEINQLHLDLIPVGSSVRDANGKSYKINGYNSEGSPTKHYVLLDRDFETAGTNTLSFAPVYSYYYRLRKVDSNGYKTVSYPAGLEEMKVAPLLTNTNTNYNIHHRVLLPPSLPFSDNSSYVLDVFRTKGNEAAPYYLVRTLPISSNDRYLSFQDKTNDEDLFEQDNISISQLGGEVGTGWESMPQGKYFTTAGNRSVVANIRSEPKMNLVFEIIKSNQEDFDAPKLGWTEFKLTSKGVSQTYVLVAPDTGPPASNVYSIISSGAYNTTTKIQTFTTNYDHSLIKGDWVYLHKKDSGNKELCSYGGWYQCADGTGGSTLNLPMETAKIYNVNDSNKVWGLNGGAIPVVIDTDLNWDGTGDSYWKFFRFPIRLAAAIRATNTLQIRAEAGDTLGQGELTLYGEEVFTLEILADIPFANAVSVTLNGVKQTANNSYDYSFQSIRQLFPSRLVASYQNYPELFDSCFVSRDQDSESAIDVNSADGQEIVAVQPFFGDSAFGQGSKESTLLVLKTNSAYLVDLNAKKAGQNAVQKLDTQGQGCIYPRSLAQTRFGLMFANLSGLWKITQDLRLSPIGRRLDRTWKQDLTPNIPASDIPAAHNWTQESRYRLVVDGSNGASYNYAREYLPDGYRDGSWATVSDYPSLGFANLGSGAFMASGAGQVLEIYSNRFQEPFCASGRAIRSDAYLAAQDFGDASRRKAVRNLIVQLRTDSSVTGLEVYSATDMTRNWLQMDPLTVEVPTSNGLSDSSYPIISSFKFTPTISHCTQFQVRLLHEKQEKVQIVSVGYNVRGLTVKGIPDAASVGKE
jgi:hypothetical protein